MGYPRTWPRRSRPSRGLRPPISMLLVLCICLGAVAAGIWLGKYVYDTILTSGSPGPTTGSPPQASPAQPARETWSVLPPGAELWWVQAGAFLDPARVQTVTAGLEAKGFPVHVSSRGPAPVLHKIKVGVFGDKAAARALEKDLKAAGFEVYLGALPLNAHPVTIAATDRTYLEEVGAGLELLGGFLADQACWWGAGGGWSLDRTAVRSALATLAPSIRQLQANLASKPAPVEGAELHQQVTALVNLAVGNLSELEAYLAGGDRARMVAAMAEFMRLVDAYDRFWASEDPAS